MPLYKAVLLILCINLVMCHKQMKEWRKHNKFASKKFFPCKVPQPRVFYIKDLVEGKEWEEKYAPFKNSIRPLATVLHKCDSAGCCDGMSERCQPTKVIEVSLTFAFLFKEMKFFDIKGENHTECACFPVTNKIVK